MITKFGNRITAADQIYEHVFENGMKHRMFPANEISLLQTYKYVREWYSQQMLDELEKDHKHGVKLVIASRLEPQNSTWIF